MSYKVHTDHLRLLELSPFERRLRGGWRWGTKRISDAVVARLVDSRRAEIRGDRVIAVAAPTTTGGAMVP
ncbi:hypothetical protein BRADO3603 [Bradyrhizobium sp. ORS 278]|uniref:hypothetical protein n=1 Tax=Bradyrhizobium sp. (strain ORS 278) TaxID=114615 RepID=UPI0001508D65|nr:hypothetical protein [Bradyrhizobium sp. ORS 278]CAL77381.1 hypothetical protein BRADO3603 [Bradyrhizobium sp. ORS 278]